MKAEVELSLHICANYCQRLNFNISPIFYRLCRNVNISMKAKVVIKLIRQLFRSILKFGGLKWTRTTDLTLIRRAL